MNPKGTLRLTKTGNTNMRVNNERSEMSKSCVVVKSYDRMFLGFLCRKADLINPNFLCFSGNICKTSC